MLTNLDYVLNGTGHGEVGQELVRHRFDPGFFRPYIDRAGERCVTINQGYRYNHDTGEYEPRPTKLRIADLMQRGIWHPTWNTTSLRIRDWIQMQSAVEMAARARLRAWGDLASSSTVGGFNAMAKMTYEYEAMNDPGFANVDMDGITSGQQDSPLFKLRSIPLPITHSDFSFSERRLMISENSDTPLDTVMFEAAGRRIAETVEQTLIGTLTGPIAGYQSAGYGAHDSTTGSQVYGYTNYPYRLTKTNVTTPTGSNPNATVADVLAMRNQLYAVNRYGPYMLYHSTDWDLYMDNDYAFTNGSNWASDPTTTLRDRLRRIEGIQDVRRLDYLTSTFTFLMVQLSSDTAQAIVGMSPQVVQWDSKGGMQKNFKVMAILVPLLKADYTGSCGILQATTA